jgi:hypothetical protein
VVNRRAPHTASSGEPNIHSASMLKKMWPKVACMKPALTSCQGRKPAPGSTCPAPTGHSSSRAISASGSTICSRNMATLAINKAWVAGCNRGNIGGRPHG